MMQIMEQRIIHLFNEAMLDVATQTRFLRGYVELVVYDGVAEYDLPADLWEISRLAYNNSVLPVRSMQEMDIVRKDMWITDRAPQPECAVHNAGGMSKVRLYPIPDSQASNVEGDGVTTSFTSPYGLLTEVRILLVWSLESVSLLAAYRFGMLKPQLH